MGDGEGCDIWEWHATASGDDPNSQTRTDLLPHRLLHMLALVLPHRCSSVPVQAKKRHLRTEDGEGGAPRVRGVCAAARGAELFSRDPPEPEPPEKLCSSFSYASSAQRDASLAHRAARDAPTCVPQSGCDTHNAVDGVGERPLARLVQVGSEVEDE